MIVVTAECLYLFRYAGCYCVKVQVQIVANQEITSPAGKVVHTVNCERVTPARVEYCHCILLQIRNSQSCRRRGGTSDCPKRKNNHPCRLKSENADCHKLRNGKPCRKSETINYRRRKVGL